MDKYDVIETDQCGIALSILIRTVCHLQYDDKQGIMAAVETDNQVYMFYPSPYQSNADYLEAFTAHIKVRK